MVMRGGLDWGLFLCIFQQMWREIVNTGIKRSERVCRALAPAAAPVGAERLFQRGCRTRAGRGVKEAEGVKESDGDR